MVRVRIGIADIGGTPNRRDIRIAHAIVQANVKGLHRLDIWWVPPRVQSYVAEYVHVPLPLGYHLPILILPSLMPLKAPTELPQAVAMLAKLRMNGSHSRLESRFG